MDSDPDPGGPKNTDPDPQQWFEFSSILQSLNSKLRTLKKNGNTLGDNDAAELERVSNEASGLQKCLDNVRKQSRQHGMIMNDHRQKKQKALEAAGMPVQQAQAMAGIGGPQVQLQTKIAFSLFCNVSLTFFFS
jgi:hypothetical protein